MSTLSWDDSTKTWSWYNFSIKSENTYWDEEQFFYNVWNYAVKYRPVGDATWSDLFDPSMLSPHISNGTYSTNVASFPQLQPIAGYEYQGFRMNQQGYASSISASFYEPSDIISPLGQGVAPLPIQIQSVNGLAETTVLATVIGGVTTHAISGKADALAEATVLVIGSTPSGYYLTGTVRVGGAIAQNIRIIAVKTDGSKVFTGISNADGTFSVSVESGNYQVLGVYTDGSGIKYSSLITPYVVVA